MKKNTESNDKLLGQGVPQQNLAFRLFIEITLLIQIISPAYGFVPSTGMLDSHKSTLRSLDERTKPSCKSQTCILASFEEAIQKDVGPLPSFLTSEHTSSSSPLFPQPSRRRSSSLFPQPSRRRQRAQKAKRRNFKKPAVETRPPSSPQSIQNEARKIALLIISNFFQSWSRENQKEFSREYDDVKLSIRPSFKMIDSVLAEKEKFQLASERISAVEKELQEERSLRIKSDELIQNATVAMDEAERMIKRQEKALIKAEQKAGKEMMARLDAEKLVHNIKEQVKKMEKEIQMEILRRKELGSKLCVMEEKLKEAQEKLWSNEVKLSEEQTSRQKAEENIQIARAEKDALDESFKSEKEALFKEVEKAKDGAKVKALDYHELLQRIKAMEKSSSQTKMQLDDANKKIESIKAELRQEQNDAVKVEDDLIVAKKDRDAAVKKAKEKSKALCQAEVALDAEKMARSNAERRGQAQKEKYRKLKERAKAEASASRTAEVKYKKAETELRKAREDIKHLMREIRSAATPARTIEDEIAYSLSMKNSMKLNGEKRENKEIGDMNDDHEYSFGNLD